MPSRFFHMLASRNNGWIILGLLTTVFLWGANNAGVKYLVHFWPPILVGSTRFLIAGLLMLALLRWTHWLGKEEAVISAALRKRLWLRGGFSLAAYVAVFNMALQYTAVSHVALYLAACPVWALIAEGKGESGRLELVQRAGAAMLALLGVLILFLPELRVPAGTLRGEALGLIASLLWTNYGRQCRAFGQSLSGAAVSAHTMFCAGAMLLPLGLLECTWREILWRTELAWVQGYTILGGAVLAFALWNNALRNWKTSEVYLFNNLIPLSTMAWAHFCLGEKIGGNFWCAMSLIVGAVFLGQVKWAALFAPLRGRKQAGPMPAELKEFE